MKLITIGRNDKNDLVIDSSYVSSFHAKIENINNQDFVIEDLASMNGTFVNNFKVTGKKKVKINDKIAIANSIIDLRKLFKISDFEENENKVDFSIEFNQLESYRKEMDDKRYNIERHNMAKNNGARTGIILLPLIIYFGGGFYKDPVMGGYFFVMSTIASAFGVWLKIGNKKLRETLRLHDEEFQMNWVCPKCRQSLPSRSWKFCKLNVQNCKSCKCKW